MAHIEYRLTDRCRASASAGVEGYTPVTVREYDWVDVQTMASGTVYRRGNGWLADGGQIGGETFEAAGRTRNEAAHTVARLARRAACGTHAKGEFGRRY